MFISFEGIDFCGKSTQIEKLEEYFVALSKKVKVIREPGGTIISEKIREILLDKKNDQMVMETEILLFSASRSQLVREVIRPSLNSGFVVISDRFHDSSTAYQGYGRGLSVDDIKNIHEIAVGETLPDLTFLIDIPVEVAYQRRGVKTGHLDRIEVSDNDFYSRVRNGYLQIAKEEKRIRVIDGNRDIDLIHQDIINEIIKYETAERV